LPRQDLGFGVDPESYDIVIHIRREQDIATARQVVKNFAQENGFSLADVTKVTTAVSELARNVYRYAGTGSVCLRRTTRDHGTPGLEIVAVDRGPGISDVARVLAGGFSTYERSLGIGLAGVRRLMDEFEIRSEPGAGTLVRVTKYRRSL